MRYAVHAAIAAACGCAALAATGTGHASPSRAAATPCPLSSSFVVSHRAWRKTIETLDPRYGCGAGFVRCTPGAVKVAVWGTYWRSKQAALHVDVKAYLEYRHGTGSWLGATKSGYRWNAGQTDTPGSLRSGFFSDGSTKWFSGEHVWATGASSNLDDATVRVHVVMRWRQESSPTDTTVQRYDEYAGYCRIVADSSGGGDAVGLG
jgi:hypothetical protein